MRIQILILGFKGLNLSTRAVCEEDPLYQDLGQTSNVSWDEPNLVS